MYIPHFVYSNQTFGLWCFVYYEQYCYEHEYTNTCIQFPAFSFFQNIPRSKIAGSYDNFMFKFLRNYLRILKCRKPHNCFRKALSWYVQQHSCINGENFCSKKPCCCSPVILCLQHSPHLPNICRVLFMCHTVRGTGAQQ